jgi:hypothetical protein
MATASNIVQRQQDVSVPNKLSAQIVELGQAPQQPMHAATMQFVNSVAQKD